jgi:hypothetical protein
MIICLYLVEVYGEQVSTRRWFLKTLGVYAKDHFPVSSCSISHVFGIYVMETGRILGTIVDTVDSPVIVPLNPL